MSSPWPAPSPEPHAHNDHAHFDQAILNEQRLKVGGCEIANGTSFDWRCSCGHLVGAHAAPMGICIDCLRGEVCSICGATVSDPTRHAQWHINQGA